MASNCERMLFSPGSILENMGSDKMRCHLFLTFILGTFVSITLWFTHVFDNLRSPNEIKSNDLSISYIWIFALKDKIFTECGGSHLQSQHSEGWCRGYATTSHLSWATDVRLYRKNSWTKKNWKFWLMLWGLISLVFFWRLHLKNGYFSRVWWPIKLLS